MLLSVSYLCFILAYFNISRTRLQLLKTMYRKSLETLPKNLCWSPFLTSCRPRACNSIKIESPALVFATGFSKIVSGQPFTEQS